jgi:SpoVK/Ycf46/Vps4 family AAA+-type ATPase
MLWQPWKRSGVAALQTTAEAFVPPRFVDEVAGHVLLNDLFPLAVPLMLAIIGPSGTGKSWQVREIGRQLGWHVVELDASSLAGEREGAVVRILHDAYLEAGEGHDGGSHSFMLIDDFDLSMASIRSHVETSQHSQLLTSALMELCDRPDRIRRDLPRRVPIILTTNSLDAVYGPLIRYGRMHIFHWAPTPEELGAILERVFAGLPPVVRLAIVERFSGEGLAFFTAVRAAVLKRLVVARIRQAGGAAGQSDVRDIEAEFVCTPLAAFEEIGDSILQSRTTLTYLRS